MPKINPFNPNSPVNPGMFSGRLKEIETLESTLFQTRAGYPTNFMITGERGIGKSSLLIYLKYVAQGLIDIENEKLNFLVIDSDIDQNTTQLNLIKKIELGLRKELAKTELARNFLNETWNFLQKIEVAGVKINQTQKIEDTLLDEFAYILSDVVNRITDKNESKSLFNSCYDGIIILIDEADNCSSTLGLGSFLKLLTERLQRRGCVNVMIGLAGLPHLRDSLLSSHESSLRLFDEITLGRLDKDEINDVIEKCIQKAIEKNQTIIEITDEARNRLIYFSEGYPHFIQQFGFSAFRVDTDFKIDSDDVIKGAFGQLGALELIGNRYYRDNFYNKIQKESYRQVLRIMADKLDSWITKQEIKNKFKGNDNILNNAIKALRDRHIILAKEGVRGVYRLQHKGFGLWIKHYTSDPENIAK